MTTSAAKRALAQAIGYYHLPEDSFSITNRHLVSKDGRLDFPIRKLITIIPAHGTVMAIFRRYR